MATGNGGTMSNELNDTIRLLMRAGGVQDPSNVALIGGAAAKLFSLIKKRRGKKARHRKQPEGASKEPPQPPGEDAPIMSPEKREETPKSTDAPSEKEEAASRQREFERLGGMQKLPEKTQPSMAEIWQKKKGSYFSPYELQMLSEEMGIHVSQVKQLVRAKEHDDSAEQAPPPDRTEKEEIASVMQAQGDPSKVSQATDAAQLGLDAAGVFDPTPISDGANAAVSVGRMFTDRKRWKTHASNAAISTVSMVPYAGDFAKVLKARHAAKVAKRAGKVTPPPIEKNTIGKSPNTPPIEKSPVGQAEKRERREGLRAKTKRFASAMFGSDDEEVQQDGMESQPGGPTVRKRDSQGRFLPSSQQGGGEPPPSASEEAKGVAAFDRWSGRLDKAGEKLMKFAGPVGKAAMASAAFVKGLSLLNAGVLALNRDLAQYSGGVATAYARSDAADVQRKFRKGEALSGPLQDLADEQAELKDSLQKATLPVEAVLLKILTKVTSATNTGLSYAEAFAQAIPPVAMAIEAIKAAAEDAAADDTTGFRRFFEDAADGKFDGHRPTFGGRGGQRILNEADHKDVFG